MGSFSVDLTKVSDWDKFQVFMDDYHRCINNEIEKLANELGVTLECASDVYYLRTRSRHTPELEAELIRLHEAGIPPNMCEFPK